MANDDFNAYDENMARQTAQAKILREAKEQLGKTSAELANLLGVSLPTLNSWLLPTKANARRNMPKTVKLLLAYVLKDRTLSAKRPHLKRTKATTP